MAIIMLLDLPGGAVPGTTLPRSDLVAYTAIQMAVQDVLSTCMSPVLKNGRSGVGGVNFVNPTGYVTVGM